MSCVNCNQRGKSYTLQAHVFEADGGIELTFCSTDCLEDWV